MCQAQVIVNELKLFCRRRKKILILCPLLVVGLSIGVSYLLPPEYKSSITILAGRDETLNPMVRYNLAVALVSEDRLRSFNEIIYSRSTMSLLIDSLGLAGENDNDIIRGELIEQVRRDVVTSLKASDSFSITYYANDPVLAKKGVQILSDHFIKTKLQLENNRNNQTVAFFQSKLAELQGVVKKREKELLARIQENVQKLPREDEDLKRGLTEVKKQLNELNLNVQDIRGQLELVKAVNNGEQDLEALFQVNLVSFPSGKQLQTLLDEYKTLTRKYTSSFPKMEQVRSNIFDWTSRLKSEIESELFYKRAQKTFLQSQYDEMAREIEQLTLTEKKTTQTQLDYDIYRTLYDQMKVKLEQAKTTRDLGRTAENQFIVLDPPVIPQKPARPNRRLLVAGGLALGLFLAFITASVAEFLDTTIRRPEDIQEFNKPVVAYILEAKR